MTKRILDFYASVETVTTQLVKMIVSIFTFSIGEIAPLAAPIAPAFSVFKALAERLETPFYVALAGAIAIELVGIFISKTAIHCHNWNSTRTKTEAEAPKALAIAMAAIFFAVVLILSLTIEIDPRLAILVYPGFVLIAITTYTALAVSNNLTVWERERAERHALQAERSGLAADIRQAKKDLEKLQNVIRNAGLEVQNLSAKKAALLAEIDAKKAANSGDAAQNNTFISGNIAALQQAKTAKQRKIEVRQSEVLRLFQDGKKPPEIADLVGVSVDTIRRDIKVLNGSVK